VRQILRSCQSRLRAISAVIVQYLRCAGVTI